MKLQNLQVLAQYYYHNYHIKLDTHNYIKPVLQL